MSNIGPNINISNAHRRNNTGAKKGIARRNGKWIAYIYVGAKQIFLGYFCFKYQAVDARKDAERKYWS